MSTPTLLPNANSTFASRPTDFAPHHQSFSSYSQSGADKHDSSPARTTSLPPPAASASTSASISTRSPHSSSSSISSAASSSSPSSSASAYAPGSSMFGETLSSSRGRQRRLTTDSSSGSGSTRLGGLGGSRSTDGSVGSLATTVSSGSPPPSKASPAAAEDDEMRETSGEDSLLRPRDHPETAAMNMMRRRSTSGTAGGMDISTLSVREEEDDGDATMNTTTGHGGGSSVPNDASGASATAFGGRKARTASVFSSSSGKSTMLPNGTEGAHASVEDDATGEAASGRVGRRKAPRMGSFHGENEPSVSGSAAESAAVSATASSSSSVPATPSTVSPASQQAGANTAPSVHHVDIVSYPPSELLRLLACLLEQIAQANDARTARASAAAAAATAASVATVGQAVDPSAATSSASSATASAAPSVGPGTRRNSVAGSSGDQEADFSQGRFDAAPLNTPVGLRQGHSQMHMTRQRPTVGGPGGPGILDNALNSSEGAGEGESETEAELADQLAAEMPTTPGVDLLRETATGPGGGVEGFMPSLGGTHAPMPLGRRRGSSFVRNRRGGPGGPSGGPGAGEDGSGFGAGSGLGAGASGRRASAMQGGHTMSGQHQQHAAGTLAGQSSNSSSPSTSRPGSSVGAHVGASSQSTPSLAVPGAGGHASSPSSPSPSDPPLSSLFSASTVALSSPNATLCFHARNVPAISIEAYLQRILKYCPTTNEVFLALLVYFDRMARIGLEAQRLGLPKETGPGQPSASTSAPDGAASGAPNPNKLFAIDSFNVHRLVIAGVTVASKFFSDVFYTNSRYAKVGGLPLHELNQLELQFLLLNDFRLKIPTDELQRYADQLILYWVGRNGTSNPAAAAAGQSRGASRARAPDASAVPARTTGHVQESVAPSQAVETPPLTRSAVAAASAQAQQSASPGDVGSPSSRQSDAHSSHYPAHLAHSIYQPVNAPASNAGSLPSTPASGAGSRPDPHGTPLQRPASSSVPRRAAHGQTLAHSPHRPRSIRSLPSTSSSFSSSTVTPGTPSTTRGDEDEEGEEEGADSNLWYDEHDGGETEGRGDRGEWGAGRGRGKGRGASWGAASGEAMQED